MLEEVRGKDDVQAVVLEQPFVGAVLQDDFDALADSRVRVRVEVHRELLTAADVPNELAPAGAQIQHRVRRSNKPIEERTGQHLPDLLTVSLKASETVSVFGSKNALRHSIFLCSKLNS